MMYPPPQYPQFHISIDPFTNLAYAGKRCYYYCYYYYYYYNITNIIVIIVTITITITVVIIIIIIITINNSSIIIDYYC